MRNFTKEEREAIKVLLALITKENGGMLTPQSVVEYARNNPDTILYECFEWDDVSAAEKHRIEQARTLIRGVKVVIKTEVKEFNSVGYVRDPRKPSRESGYVPIKRVRSKEMKRNVLLNEFERAAGAIRRARQIAEVFGLEEQMDDLLASIQTYTETVSSASLQ